MKKAARCLILWRSFILQMGRRHYDFALFVRLSVRVTIRWAWFSCEQVMSVDTVTFCGILLFRGKDQYAGERAGGGRPRVQWRVASYPQSTTNCNFNCELWFILHVAMDVGSTTRVKSAHMNDTVILYHSVRQVGFVYKFNLKRRNDEKTKRVSLLQM